MPHQILAFLCKKPDLSTQQFIDYYEHKHLPLIVSLSGDTLPTTYKRRYTHRDATIDPDSETLFGAQLLPANGKTGIEYDVVVELVWPTKAASHAWFAQINKDGGGEKIRIDEEVFLDRSRTTAFVVEEHVTRDMR